MIQNNKINQQTVIFANTQINGRGKKDAIWKSPIGNIYLSFIFPIPLGNLTIYNNFQDCSLLIGLSLHEVINFYKNKEYDIKIKKPNDILINGKKVAGILIESINHEDSCYLIVGIGINWENAPLKTSDYIKKFLKINKNEFIFHLLMNVREKISNFQLYSHRISII